MLTGTFTLTIFVLIENCLIYNINNTEHTCLLVRFYDFINAPNQTELAQFGFNTICFYLRFFFVEIIFWEPQFNMVK